MKEVDKNEAPEGLIALPFVAGTVNTCDNCYFGYDRITHCGPCTPCERNDGCSVIFLKKEK